MKKNRVIPLLSTQELWARYVKAEVNITDFFTGKSEDFLVMRLEDTKSLPNLPVHPHRRNVNEIVFVTSGQVICGVNLNSVEVNASEIHLVLANQITTVDYFSENLTGYYCHFSLETIIRLYHKEPMVSELALLHGYMKHKPVKLTNKAFLAIRAIFERLIDEYRTNHEASLINAYLVALCYEIRAAIPSGQSGERLVKGYDLTEQFRQLIVKYLYEHQSVAFYARLMGITPNHLNKVVKQTTGKQASALINESLMLEAKVLLKHSDLSVSEIAFNLGFIDHSYFSRFFKAHAGNSPKAYRLLK